MLRIPFSRATSRGVVGRLFISGKALEDAEFELSFLMVHVFDDGRLVRVEFFPDDELDAAMALVAE